MKGASRAAEPNLFDEPSLAHLLRVTLVAIVASSLAVAAFTLVLKWALIPQLSLLAAASTLAALLLSHFGRIRPAVFVSIACIAFAVLCGAAKNDGIQSIGLRSFLSCSWWAACC